MPDNIVFTRQPRNPRDQTNPWAHRTHWPLATWQKAVSQHGLSDRAGGRYLWAKQDPPGSCYWDSVLASDSSAKDNPLHTPPWATCVVWLAD